MIGDDGDSKRSSLEVVFPLSESKDDRKQFSVINIVVSFGEEEYFGEVGTGMKVAVDILCIRMAPAARREASVMREKS